MDIARLRDLVRLRLLRSVQANLPVGRARARLSALALLAAFVLIEGLTTGHIPVVTGDETGTLTVTPAFANSGKTITVVVSDESPSTTVLNELEATDFTGNLYSRPAGLAGKQHIFRVKNSPIADLNGDGKTDTNDLLTTLTDTNIDWVSPQNGTFAITQFFDTSTPTGFTVTYRHNVVDKTTVEVRSSSDLDGFVMTLGETGPATNIYTAKFITGTATAKTNLTDPNASTRPTIKVADGGIATVEYTDTTPPTLVSEAVVIDTTPPVLTVTQLPNGVTTSNAQNWVTVDVTDTISGVELSDITFGVDIDRDGKFDGPGETVQASTDFSSEINNGWAAFGFLTGISDGKVSWFATATDVAGNTAQTDSSTAAEIQHYTFEIDTVPPGVTGVFLGDDYDDANDLAVTNRPNRMRVNFSEPVDPETVVPGRFLSGSLPATKAVVYSDLPSSVFLEFENLSSIAEPMQVLAGAVTDLLGLNSEKIVWQVEDRLGPTLEVDFDTVITRDKLTITSRSPETLATVPTVEINGVTFGAMTPTEKPREWIIEIDDDLLTGAAAGDGVKNVEIAGFDRLGNRAHGGVRREDPAWPKDAHLFELDRKIKLPTILPASNDVVKVVDPVITVSYADEASEYEGDTHSSVTVISAKLNGFDVTALMQATTASSWTYQPGSLEAGPHEFTIQSRDDAGNIHAPPVLRFIVEPPPTPTPVPTEVVTPEPTVEIEDPGATPPPELIGTPTPVPTVEATAAPTPDPEVTPDPEATAVPTPDPEVTPDPEETPDPDAPTPEPTVDVEATVQAIRDGDSSGGTDDPGSTLSEEPEYTVYGCGLPLGHAGAAIGDYTLIGLGMVGLVVLARRRRSGEKDGAN